MTSKRRKYSSTFKFKVALEAAKNNKTRSQLATEYEVHPTQISQWKKRLVEDGNQLFAEKRSRRSKRQEQDALKQEQDLYEQIGRLKMELEWLKKKVGQVS